MKCLSVLEGYVCSGQRGNALILLKEMLSEQPGGLGHLVGNLLDSVHKAATKVMHADKWEEETVLRVERLLSRAIGSVKAHLEESSVAMKLKKILDELARGEIRITALLRHFQENIEAEWR